MIDKQYYLKLSADAQVNYTQYKKEAEARVIKKEYTTSKRYDLSPYWFERNSDFMGELTEEITD